MGKYANIYAIYEVTGINHVSKSAVQDDEAGGHLPGWHSETTVKRYWTRCSERKRERERERKETLDSINFMINISEKKVHVCTEGLALGQLYCQKKKKNQIHAVVAATLNLLPN